MSAELIAYLEAQKSAENAAAASPHFGARYNAPLPSTHSEVRDVLDNPSIAGLPTPVTLHLFRPSNATQVVANADAHALITYSNGSVSNSFKCDWEGQLSLVATAVKVQLVSYAPLDQAGVLLGGYSASATVNRVYGALLGIGGGAQSGKDPISFTSEGFYLDASGGGMSVNDYVIPAFARRYFPMLGGDPDDVTGNAVPTSAEIAQMSVRFHASTNNRMVAYPLTIERMLEGIPIPAGARLLRFQNDGANYFNLIHHFKLGL